MLPPSRFARFGPPAALLTLGGALALMLVGLFVGSAQHAASGCWRSASGRSAVFIGVALLRAAARAAAGRGARAGPRRGSRGVAGRLARANAMRNPTRTASTAAALMIGLALVTFVAVLGGRAEVDLRKRGQRDLRAPTT